MYIYYIGELLKSLLQTRLFISQNRFINLNNQPKNCCLLRESIMKNNDLLAKTTVTKSRSMSILIKEKIGIALGKKTENRESNSKKTSHGSYLSKERSSSLKSLNKTRNTSSKNSRQLTQKLSFYEQTPSKPKILIESRKQQTQRPKTVLSTHKNQPHSDRLSYSSSQKFDQLLWIDSSQRKFKIVNKNVQTLGQEAGMQRYVDYCIGDREEVVVMRIQGDSLRLVDNGSGRYWAKYDEKSGKIQHLSNGKELLSIKLNFEGYIFLYHNPNQKISLGHQIFSFFIQQINKLKDDGLKQFPIITKIVKRQFQEKYPQMTQQFYLFLMKAQGNLAVKKQKTLDTQKLISQKLQCKDIVTGYQNTKTIAQSLFNRKKFME